MSIKDKIFGKIVDFIVPKLSASNLTKVEAAANIERSDRIFREYDDFEDIDKVEKL